MNHSVNFLFLRSGCVYIIMYEYLYSSSDLRR